MHSHPRQTGSLLRGSPLPQHLAVALATGVMVAALVPLCHVFAAAAPAAAPAVAERWSDSPDGDPLTRTFDFDPRVVPLAELGIVPGAAAPGVAPGAAPGSTPGAAPAPLTGDLTSDFVLAGELPEGDTAAGVAFTPDGATLVIAHRDSRNLVLFDAATRVFLQAISLSGSPNDLAIAADGVHAVTANVFENTASMVDLVAGTETAVIPVGTQPGVVRISPDGTTAVVGNTVDASLSVIDIASATELRRITGTGFVATVTVAFESGAITAAFSDFEFSGNQELVHPDFYADAIHLIDVSTGAVDTLPAAGSPRGVAVAAAGSPAVVSHFLTPQLLSVVDVAAHTIAKTIPVGTDLWGPVAIDGTGTKAVVAVQNACRVVNLVTNAVSGNLATASVNQLHTTADGLYALAVGYRGALIAYASESIVAQLNNIVSTAVGAVSPAGPRAAMAANVFGEDLLVVNTAGAGGSIEGHLPSGPPPEGDKARTVALSPDGSKAVVASILSDNASIVDVGTLAVEAIVDLGDRPADVAFTPDGTRAVVTNLDASFVSVIDLASHAVAQVNISTRGSQVEISPDGHYAYVAVVASGDGVWRVDLPALAVAGPRLFTGNMGGVLYQFGQASGMTLSHDGMTLVTCNSFDDTISIIDTAAWQVVATVAVGDFPVRAAFAPDDATIYVANRTAGTVTVVDNAGAGSAVTGTITVGAWPWEMAASPGGDTLYVANFQDSNIGVVELAGGVMTSVIPLPNPPAALHLAASGKLYVASGTWSVSIGPGPLFSIAVAGEFSRIDTGSGTIDDQLVTGLPPAMLVFNDTAALAAVPSPFGDGLTLVHDGATTGVGDEAGGGGAAGAGTGGDATPAPPARLLAPRPNPLVSRTAVRFTLARAGRVRLAVHDVRGRQVAVLVDGARLAAGAHAVDWDGRRGGGGGRGGERVAAGVYFVRLEAGGARPQGAKLLVVE